jgi:predicted amidohydrolase YtcJ
MGVLVYMKTDNTKYQPLSADLIITNGKVVTVDKNFSIAQAVAVKNEKIIAVGSNRDIKKLAGSNTEVIDLKGKTMLPGINDAHAHVTDWGLSRPPFSLNVSFPEVNSLYDIIQMISQKYKEVKRGEWIQGTGWDEGYLKEHKADPNWLPKKEDLDRVSPDIPVALYDYSGHRALVNSKALELAGITKDTPDPVGGKITRNPDTGELNGLLYEKATLPVSALFPPLTREKASKGLLAGMAALNALGITSFTDAVVNRDLWIVYNDVYNDYFDQGKWTCRVNLLLSLSGHGGFKPDVPTCPEDVEKALYYIGCKHNFGNEWLKIAGVKVAADGISTLKTAWMYEEYEGGGVGGLVTKGDTPQEKENNLREIIKLLHKNRFQVGIHCCGSRAVDICYDQFMKCILEDPWDARHYCCHNEFANPETIKRIGEFCRNNPYKVSMNVQSFIRSTIADFMASVVGTQLAAYHWPLRTMLDAGIIVTDSSDALITSPNFLEGIQSAVLREAKATGKVIGQEQAITVKEAIINFTINGAWQDHQEKIKGSIEAGKLADFCVLDGDILTIEPHDIRKLKNIMTIIGGKIVYQTA